MTKKAHDIASDPDYANVGAAIDEARRSAGLSKAALAEKLGWSRQAVTYLCDGTRRLDVVELVRIADATGQSPVNLFHAVVAGMPKPSSTR